MARLSTHVLDTAHGRPAAGVSIRLYDGQRLLLGEFETNPDGRAAAPTELPPGVYELVFAIGVYFGAQGTPFLNDVVVRFGIEDPAAKYHVPLLVSPYGYTTYRGS
jgi:5-hydroxyisourate hydrolase